MLIPYEDFIQKVNVFRSLYGNYAGSTIQYYEGNMVFKGDLDLDKEEHRGIAIKGNVTVEGNVINAEGYSGSFLFISGNLKTHNLIAGGSEIVVQGTAEIEGVVFGHYNDGDLMINKLIASLCLSSDHSMRIEDEAGVKFNIGNLRGNSTDLTQIFSKEILDMDEEPPILIDNLLIEKILKKENFFVPSFPLCEKFIAQGLINV